MNLARALAAFALLLTAAPAFAQSQRLPVPVPTNFGGNGNATGPFATPFTSPGATAGDSDAGRWAHRRDTVSDYGWKGDGQTGNVNLTAGSPAFSGSAMPGQLFAVPGVGANGGPFQTTVAPGGALSAAPAFSTGTFYADGEVCPIASGGHGSRAAPGDTFTIGGGTFNAPTICKVFSVGVYGASVAAAGSGATPTAPDGTCIVTGTTGTTGAGVSVRASALVTIDPNTSGILAVLAVYYPGQYTVLPDDPTQEPVTTVSPGCQGLTGAKLNLTMGVNLAMLTQPGNAPSAPGATQTPTATSGLATDAVFALPYVQSGPAWWGTDNLANIRNVATNAPAGWLYAPAGVYMTSCPPSTDYFLFAHAVSLFGDPGQSVIRLSPWCQLPLGNRMFRYSAASGVRWRDMTIDANNAVQTGYNPMNRTVHALVYVTGGGRGAKFTGNQFLNMRSGAIGLWGFFFGSGGDFSDLEASENFCTELTTNGNTSHCLYFGDNGTAKLHDLTLRRNVSQGANIAFEADGGHVEDNDVSGQGYGPGIGAGFGPTLPSTNFVLSGNRLHDANNGVEVGDADIPSGMETYCSGCKFAFNQSWNNGGSGFRFCAQHDEIIGNQAWDNGGALGPNQLTGSVRWQFNAGFALMRASGLVSPGLVCDANGSLLVGNQAWDSYTWAGANAANGQSQAGLTPTQHFGFAESGFSSADLNKIIAANDFDYNVDGPAYANGSENVDFAVFPLATSSSDLIPSKHLSNLVGKTSATICITGDSTSLNVQTNGNMADPQQSPANMLFEQLQAQNPQITAWSFQDYGIGGTNENQFTLAGATFGKPLPVWYTDPNVVWSNYVKAANCDVLFYMFGTNGASLGKITGSTTAASIKVNMIELNSWAYPPNVVMVTNKAASLIDGSDDAALSSHISQIAFHRYFARSNARGYTSFPIIKAMGIGLIDLGRHAVGRMVGFDLDAQYFETVPSAIAASIPLASNSIVGRNASTVATSLHGDFRLGVDLGAVGGAALFSECPVVGVGLGQWNSNYVRLEVASNGTITPKLIIDGVTTAAPMQAGSPQATTGGADVNFVVTKSGMHVAVVINGVTALDTVAATYTGSPPGGTPINVTCLSGLGDGPYTFAVTEYWQGHGTKTKVIADSIHTYGQGTSCWITDYLCQGGNGINHQKGSSANFDREYIYSLNMSVPPTRFTPQEFKTWPEATVAGGATVYFWGENAQEANQTIPAVVRYAGVVRNLSVQIVNAPAASSVTVQLYAGHSAGTVAPTSVICSMAAGQTTCTDAVDTYNFTANDLYFWKLTNSDTQATGGISLKFQIDRLN